MGIKSISPHELAQFYNAQTQCNISLSFKQKKLNKPLLFRHLGMKKLEIKYERDLKLLTLCSNSPAKVGRSLLEELNKKKAVFTHAQSKPQSDVSIVL